MNFTLKQAIFTVLAAIIIVGGYFSWQFISKETQPTAPPKNYKIGFLVLTEKDAQNENFNGFKSQMGKLGYKEGVNIEYIMKIATRDPGALDKAAAEANEAGWDIILVGSTSAGEALKKLPDLKTKVFFLAAGRPKALVENFVAPEGLITGMGEPTAEFAGKRLEFLKELIPSLKKIVSIVDRGHATGLAFVKSMEAAAAPLGLKIEIITAENPGDLVNKIPLIKRDGGTVAYVACSCPSNTQHPKELADYFLKNKMPSISDEVEIGARIGWLATYSNDRRKAGERGAVLVDRIVKGTPISKVPVESANDVLLEINLNTAKTLGITFPQSVLSRANKIYQE